MAALTDVLEKARSLKFGHITTRLRVNRKSSSVTVRLWRGEVTVHKVQVTAISPVRAQAEEAHARVVEDVRAVFPGVPVNGIVVVSCERCFRPPWQERASAAAAPGGNKPKLCGRCQALEAGPLPTHSVRCATCGEVHSKDDLRTDGYACRRCGERVCAVCGCTDSSACPDGCWWLRPGVCSTHGGASSTKDLAAAMSFPPPASLPGRKLKRSRAEKADN
jgi:DNA-directed RNA polymerase subunit RPC12/RpoP